MKTKTKSRRVLPFSFRSTFKSKKDYPSLRCGWTLGVLFLVAGRDQIYNFLEGYELVVELWKKG
jgi:hypothetical protein